MNSLLKSAMFFYWTDSQVVLDWIGSSKKQPVFVANRIAEIKVKSKPDNCNHIAANLNPADHGTRGLEPKEIEAKWFKRPDFLSTNDVFCRPTKQMPICAATTRSALRTKTPVLDPKVFNMDKDFANDSYCFQSDLQSEETAWQSPSKHCWRHWIIKILLDTNVASQ